MLVRDDTLAPSTRRAWRESRYRLACRGARASFRPTGHIAKLVSETARASDKARASAIARPPERIETCAREWVQLKFKSYGGQSVAAPVSAFHAPRAGIAAGDQSPITSSRARVQRYQQRSW
jgi:hypothetical protein